MSIHFKLSSLASKTAIIGGFLVCIMLFALSVTVYLGSAVSRGATELATAQFAIKLAPSDAEGYLAAAAFLENSMRLEDQPRAIRYYEEAAALQPNNYVYWYALANAKERSGDPAGAEKAMRKASDLAPNYTEVLWALETFLSGKGRTKRGSVRFARRSRATRSLPFPPPRSRGT